MPDGWILYSLKLNSAGPWHCIRDRVDAEMYWAHLLELPGWATHNITGVRFVAGEPQWNQHAGHLGCGIELGHTATEHDASSVYATLLLDEQFGREPDVQARHTGWVVDPHLQPDKCHITVYSTHERAWSHGTPVEVRFSGAPMFYEFEARLCMAWEFKVPNTCAAHSPTCPHNSAHTLSRIEWSPPPPEPSRSFWDMLDEDTYGYDMRCIVGGEWLGPYGECTTDHP